jgi:Protein of unknown function (DUF3052)
LPRPKRKKTREPERDYSHRSLLDKLGVKPGQRIALVGIKDAEFRRELVARVPEFAREKPQDDLDLVFYRAESAEALPRLKNLARVIKRDGAIWVIYPKGRAHLCELDVFTAGKAAGLVDNKVARFSETHTALRFVIPLAKR